MKSSFLAVLIAASVLIAQRAHAVTISSDDIVALPLHLAGSGNGTLDLRMFTFSGSEIGNDAAAFNGDNGNNSLPQGGGADTSSFVESYVTTAGEMKIFFDLNFTPPGSIREIMLLLDLNETGGGEDVNILETLNVVLNPTSIQGDPDPFGDVSSDVQAAIDAVFLGGTIIASLDPQLAANLPVTSEGAGFADYAIFTGIDPFALDDNDVLLFNIGMSHLSAAAEEIFLSGTLAPSEIRLPEPSAFVLLAMSLVGLGGCAWSCRS